MGTTAGTGADAATAMLLTEHLRAAVLDALVDAKGAASRDATLDHASRKLTMLAGAVRACADGNRGEAETLPRTALSRQLLGYLRRAFLRRMSAQVVPPEASALLAALEAFEAVSEVLEPEGGRPGLAERMSGPDGAELIVEVAHDLRSPLTAILFLAETLLRGRSGPITPVQERQLGLIYSAAFGLSSVASDVLELVRGSERMSDVEPAPFSVQELLEHIEGIVLPMAEEKGLALEMHGPKKDLRVGRQVALSRVLLNLTTNALKFTNQGMVSVSVVEIDERRVEFSVKDTGRGIPSAAMATLFEPFRRRPDVRHQFAFSGAGLGLSICRKFVEAMHSTLEVETAPNQGTRFYFVLDLPPADSGLLIG